MSSFKEIKVELVEALKEIKDKLITVESIIEKSNEEDSDDVIEDTPKVNNNQKFTSVTILRNHKLLTNLFDHIVREDGFICGGFARVCTSTNKDIVPSGDIDIYCKNKEAFDSIRDRLEMNGYLEERKSETALTMQHSFSGALPIQLIMPLNEGKVLLSSEDVEDILDNFDFTIARVGITSDTLLSNTAIADVDFLSDESNKRLNIKNIHCPIAQVYRVSKYMEKGYWLPMTQTLSIFKDWDNRDSEYKDKLINIAEEENPSQEQIQHLERMLHID